MSKREVCLVFCICLLAVIGVTFVASSLKAENKYVAAEQAAAQVSKVFRTGNCTVYRIVVEDHAYLVNDQGGICPMPAAVPEKH